MTNGPEAGRHRSPAERTPAGVHTLSTIGASGIALILLLSAAGVVAGVLHRQAPTPLSWAGATAATLPGADLGVDSGVPGEVDDEGGAGAPTGASGIPTTEAGLTPIPVVAGPLPVAPRTQAANPLGTLSRPPAPVRTTRPTRSRPQAVTAQLSCTMIGRRVKATLSVNSTGPVAVVVYAGTGASATTVEGSARVSATGRAAPAVCWATVDGRMIGPTAARHTTTDPSDTS